MSRRRGEHYLSQPKGTLPTIIRSIIQSSRIATRARDDGFLVLLIWDLLRQLCLGSEVEQGRLLVALVVDERLIHDNGSIHRLDSFEWRLS